MHRSVIETILGAIVLFVAAFFLIFSYRTANVGSADGYQVSAEFSGIGGLQVGDDVQISGVKVGSITGLELDPEKYLAVVTMSIREDIEIPNDTAAVITSESLLGGKYMALEPGAAMEMLDPGEKIQFTQSPQNLEQLLGQFIFSMQNSGDNNSGDAN